MPNNMLIDISEALAQVQRMLASLHADVQTVKREVEELRNLNLRGTVEDDALATCALMTDTPILLAVTRRP